LGISDGCCALASADAPAKIAAAAKVVRFIVMPFGGVVPVGA
jgi:hypothetical protein